MDRALTYIYGIGLTSARQILDKADLPYQMNTASGRSSKMTMSLRVTDGARSPWTSKGSWILDATVDVAIGVDCLAGVSGPKRMRALGRDLGAAQRSKRNNTLLVAYRTKGLTGS